MQEAKKEAEAIIGDAKTEAEDILANAKLESDALENEMKAVTDKKAENAAESQKSSSQLYVRNAVLLKKRQEIDKTLDELLKYLLALDTDRYFEVLLKLVKTRAGKDGVMLLNSADLSRAPEGFKNALKEQGITLSDKALDSISGGFVLKFGDVEENADFSALIAENNELLTDIIGRELF